MRTRHITGAYVARFERTSLVIAVFLIQSLACTVDTHPSEATAEQSEPVVSVASASGPATPGLVLPNLATQFPREVALQGPDQVFTVYHQSGGPVPNALIGSAR